MKDLKKTREGKSEEVQKTNLNLVQDDVYDDNLSHAAIYFEDLKSVEFLVKNGADVNIENNEGHTALFMAAQNEDVALAKFLIKKGAKLNQKDQKIIKDIAVSGNRVFVKKTGIDVNAQEKYDRTALFEAVSKQDILEVDVLLVLGAKVDAQNDNGETALFLAIRKGNIKMTRLLLEMGADINIKNNEGHTILFIAAQNGHRKLVKFLVEKGAKLTQEGKDTIKEILIESIEKRDEKMVLALIKLIKTISTKIIQDTIIETIKLNQENKEFILTKFFLEIVKYGSVGRIKDLIASKLDVYEDFFIANKYEDMELAEFLVEQGAKVTHKGKDIIEEAFMINRDYIKLVEVLIKAGIDVNSQNDNGETALFCAIRKGNIEMTRLLLEMGADINIENNEGNTALFIAAQEEDEKIVEFLVEQGAKLNQKDQKIMKEVFINMAHEGRIKLIKILIKAGININAQNYNGETALLNATSRRNIPLAVIKILTEAGIDINAQDYNGRTALFKTASRKNITIVESLLEKKAKVNLQDYNGETALFGAVSNKNREVTLPKRVNLTQQDPNRTKIFFEIIEKVNVKLTKALIEEGVEINAKNENGKTALYIAVENRKNIIVERQEKAIEIIKLLIEAGSDVNIPDKEGKTILYEAVQNRDIKAVKALKKAKAELTQKEKDNIKETLIESIEKRNEGIIVTLMPIIGRIGILAPIIKIMILNQKNKEFIKKIFFDLTASHGDKTLVKAGFDINTENNKGHTILFEVAKNRNGALAEFLVANGAKLNKKDREEGIREVENIIRIFLKGVNDKKIKVVNALIKAGIEINMKNNEGQTALFRAVSSKRNIEVVKLLLENGADVNILDKDGKTILYVAVQNKNIEAIEVLKEAKAELTQKEKDIIKETLIKSIEKRDKKIILVLQATQKISIEIVQDAIIETIKLSQENKAFILTKIFFEMVEYSDIGLIKALIAVGIDVINAQNHEGYNGLFIAAKNRDTALAEFLVAQGAKVTQKDQEIMKEVFINIVDEGYGYIKLVEILVKAGIDVNIRDDNGETALFKAARRRVIKLFEILLAAGADINAQNHEGYNGLFIAVKNRDTALAEFLVAQGAKLTQKDQEIIKEVFLGAIYNENIRLIEALIKAGIDVNMQDNQGYTVLFCAISKGNIEITRLLLEKGADINAQNHEGYNGLFIAAQNGYAELAEFLVAQGVKLTQKDQEIMKEVFLETIYNENIRLIKALIKAGIDVNIRDDNGETALFRAVSKENIEIVEILVKAGADINIQNNKGKTVLDLADEKLCQDIRNFLRKKNSTQNLLIAEANSVIYSLFKPLKALFSEEKDNILPKMENIVPSSTKTSINLLSDKIKK